MLNQKHAVMEVKRILMARRRRVVIGEYRHTVRKDRSLMDKRFAIGNGIRK